MTSTSGRGRALPVAILAAGAMVMTGLLGHSAAPAAAARAAASACPYQAVHCLTGETEVIYDPAQADKDKSFMILDGTRPDPAPQAWQGVGGFAENGNPFCATNLGYTVNVACLGGDWNNQTGLPELVLRQYGSHQPEILMYQDGRWYPVTVPMVEWIVKAMHIRPNW